MLVKSWALVSLVKFYKGKEKGQFFAELTFKIGSPGRTRTSDKAINSRLLYQLSYWGSNQRLVSVDERGYSKFF